MRFAVLAALLLVGAPARAGSLADLTGALPAGWKAELGRDTLTFVRLRPVRITGRFLDNAPHFGNAPTAPVASSPTERLQLRYRIEPAWSAARIAEVKAANAKLYASLGPLRDRYGIDELRVAKGLPIPSTPDEERRLRDYQQASDAVLARVVALPRCTLDDRGRTLSVFDDATTYAQLDLMVSPEIAMREAYAVVELIKRRCR